MTGLALLQRGIATPLLVSEAGAGNFSALTRQNLPRPYSFPSLDQYKAGLRTAGEAISNGPPVPDGPIVIGLTGLVHRPECDARLIVRAGNVSQGAKAMLDALGVEWLKPEDLPAVGERGELSQAGSSMGAQSRRNEGVCLRGPARCVFRAR